MKTSKSGPTLGIQPSFAGKKRVGENLSMKANLKINIVYGKGIAIGRV